MVTELLKKSCASAGGSYYNGACRCSDGRLKNMTTGECVSERDAGPATLPPPGKVWDSASGRYVDRNTPTGSTPRVITTVSGVGDRRARTDKRAAVANSLTPTATARGSLARSMVDILDRFKSPNGFQHVITDTGGPDAPTVELGLRYDPNAGQSKPPKDPGNSAGTQKMGAAGSTPPNGAEAAQSGLPVGLILAGLSFLLFRS